MKHPTIQQRPAAMPDAAKFESPDDPMPNGVHHFNTFEVRAMQRELGMEPCYRTPALIDCTKECLWGAQCRRPIAAWLRDW